MNVAFYKGILHGHFGQWGGPQFKQWASIAHYEKVGFEIEYYHDGKIPPPAQMLEPLKRRLTWWNPAQVEVQFLTTLKCPKSWAAQMKSELKTLSENGIVFIGSIHGNLQMRDKIDWNKPDLLYVQDIPDGAMNSLVRWENKHFIGVITPEDFILQSILYILYVKNRFKGKEAVESILKKEYETALSTYSPAQLLLSADLNKPINKWVESL